MQILLALSASLEYHDSRLQKMQTEEGVVMEKIFPKDSQNKLLISMAINKLNRKELSVAVGISMPTTRKLLSHEAPIIVSERTYQLVQEWLINNSEGK